MKQSLGLIEVRGLALAVNVADAMAKSAAIKLVGVEKTNGGGWTVIKITGDVAAVKSALNTGAALAEQFAGLVAQTALSRPDDHVLRMTVPGSLAPSCAAVAVPAEADPVTQPATDSVAVAIVATETETATETVRETDTPTTPSDVADTDTASAVSAECDESTERASNDDDAARDKANLADTESAASAAAQASCNLCHDPLCPRQKGEPRHKCLHIRG